VRVRVELDAGPQASLLYKEAEAASQDPVAALESALEAGAGAVRRVTDLGTSDAVERSLASLPEAVRRSVVEAMAEAPPHAREQQVWLGRWLQTLHEGQTGVATSVVQLAEGLRSARELAELEARTAAKGRPFEVALLHAAEEFARRHGDALHDVGDVPGVAGSKAGDQVLELADAPPPARRVAIEAKAASVSLPATLRLLDEAMAAREAQAAVIVFSRQEEAPTRGAPLRWYGRNRVACVYDPEEGPVVLEAALGLARAAALMAGGEGGVGEADLEAAVTAVTEALSDGKAVARAIAAGRRALDQAEEAYRSLTERVSSAIRDLR
jgi:hypothetical protein